MRRTVTAGQLLVNSLLPRELRDYTRVLDKKGLAELLSHVAKNYPDRYREITYRLNQLGQRVAYFSGGNSFNLEHLRMPARAKDRRIAFRHKLRKLLDDDSLSDAERDKRIVEAAQAEQKVERDEIFQDSLAEQNPLALQILGSGRGNPTNLASLRGSDWLYADHRNQVIPIPVLRSYSQGLRPAEYMAGTFGARQGVLATKLATAEAGYFGKQLAQAAHRLIVTAQDRDDEPPTMVGLPVDADDDDSEGALLAAPAGGFPRNTVLTPQILRSLRKQGIKRLLLRSPMVSGAADGGLYARDVGIRERGREPALGENVGMLAAQAISEPLSQGQLSTKHGGGVAGESKALSGFAYINQLAQSPKVFRNGATHAQTDGTVQAITAAPLGGYDVLVAGQKHYVPADAELTVKVGQAVEAGDSLSSGVPVPRELTRLKGIGSARAYFTQAMRKAMRDAGIKANRRNIELISRGLINHVRLTEELGDYVPDDVVPYATIEHRYQPRPGFRALSPETAVGRYLERPYLHYTIGTKVRPSVRKDLEEFGIKSVDVHDRAPPFEPEFVRLADNLQYDEDWLTRMYGSGLKGGLLEGVHRGGTSSSKGTSFVGKRVRAVGFSKELQGGEKTHNTGGVAGP